MRKAWLAAALLLISSGAFAAPSEEDKLFAQLHDASTPEEAHPIEQKLDGLFQISGSPTVDLLMTRAKAALGGTANDVARKLLDSVTQVAPNYAEGWRARAALQAAGNDDAGAMVSLQKAVTLNPRQFEAMTDLADMLEEYGDKPAALKLYRQALALDPQLSEAARHEKALAKELEGQGI
jgi:tetratricopeptide (TPR) repeat protein